MCDLSLLITLKRTLHYANIGLNTAPKLGYDAVEQLFSFLHPLTNSNFLQTKSEQKIDKIYEQNEQKLNNKSPKCSPATIFFFVSP